MTAVEIDTLGGYIFAVQSEIQADLEESGGGDGIDASRAGGSERVFKFGTHGFQHFKFAQLDLRSGPVISSLWQRALWPYLDYISGGRRWV